MSVHHFARCATTTWFRRPLVRAWARRMIRVNAVVIDTETTDLHGRVCEFAAIDIHGNVLFDSLVNPGEPITDGARAIHGISDDDVRHSPTLTSLLSSSPERLATRRLLAYNSDYDRLVLERHLRASGTAPRALLGSRRWGCLMKARSAFYGAPWTKLGANHRAAGDAYAAAAVLWDLAEWPLPLAIAVAIAAR